MVFHNKALAWTLAVVSLSGIANGLDLKVEKPQCQSLPISVKFDYICTGDGICTFGEVESLEGSMRYYGLVDQLGLDAYTNIYSTVDLNLRFAGMERTQNLMENIATPLCNGLFEAQADEYGDVPECPDNGDYHFETTYTLPTLDNGVADWAASGWTGDITWQIYGNSTQLLGSCTMEVQTMVTGSYEGGAFKTLPSGRSTILGLLTVLALVLMCCMYCCCAGRGRRSSDDADPNSFSRMSDDKTGDMMI